MRRIATICIICVLIVPAVTDKAVHHVGLISNSENNNNILYVGGSGPGNYSKIQDAINEALPGDTIFVYDDSSPYYENLIIDKSIKLIGENRNTTIICGGEHIVIDIQGNNVSIENLTIANNSHTWPAYGIVMEGNGIKILGNIIKNCTTAIEAWFLNESFICKNEIAGKTLIGIYLYFSNNNKISENKICVSDEAISISGNAIGNVIEGNFIMGDVWLGVEEWGFPPVFVMNTFVLNNKIFMGGLKIWKARNNIISNNTVNGKPLVYLERRRGCVIDYAGQVILVNCRNIVVKNLDISDTCVAIQLRNCKRCKIIANCIHNCTEGIALYDSKNNVVTNCILKNSSIYLWKSRCNTIKENKVKEGVIILGYLSIGNKIIKNVIDSGYGLVGVLTILNTIERNNFSSNDIGIGLTASPFNFILKNTFVGNGYGIYLAMKSGGNIIYSNNFLRNKIHATFGGCYINFWFRNYWDDWHRLIPRPIKGEGWTNYDWLPRIYPYEW